MSYSLKANEKRTYMRIYTIFGFIMILAAWPSYAQKQTATFAMGCFWCAEQAMDKIPGVLKTTSGYSGGHVVNPSYQEVSSGTTGHIESLQVEFDDSVISYSALLRAFWRNVDPLTKNQQFCDKGYQYSAAIFYHDLNQKQAAQESFNHVKKILGHNEVLILEFTNFYPAETYHQNYYQKNPIRYKYYKYSCGREKRLEKIWSSERVKALESS